MENKVKIFDEDFDLNNFKDVLTLHELEQLDVFKDLKGVNKREAESELFNNVYDYNYNVDGKPEEHKIIASLNTETKPDAIS